MYKRQLSYSAKLSNGDPLPSWLLFDGVSRTFSGTPSNAHVGEIAVEVTATDTSGAAVSNTFALQVMNTNDAPTVAVPIGDMTAVEGSTFSFAVPSNTFADVDAHDVLSISVRMADGSALPSWLVYDGATATLSGVPGSTHVGTCLLYTSPSPRD